MDANELDANPYLGRMKHLPRPAGSADGVFGRTGKDDLQRDQSAWDAAARRDAENAAPHAARVAGFDAKGRADADARRRAEADAVAADPKDLRPGRNPGAAVGDFGRDKPRPARIGAPVDRRVSGNRFGRRTGSPPGARKR